MAVAVWLGSACGGSGGIFEKKFQLQSPTGKSLRMTKSKSRFVAERRFNRPLTRPFISSITRDHS